MTEPKRDSSRTSLTPVMQVSVHLLFAAMQAKGYDPVLFETRRSQERQDWLYGIGRTHSMKRKPVTWTHHSEHFTGEAFDVISKSRGWDWLQFYAALGKEARKLGLYQIRQEQCHIQRRKP
jgi:LAS superfamily LD-carboxypeptidase LdcB